MARSLFLFVCVGLWMAFIWHHSSVPATEQDIRSRLQDWFPNLERHVPEVSFPYGNAIVTSEHPYDFIQFFMRKMGHVAEYAVLSLLLCSALFAMGLRGRAFLLLAFGLTLGYAAIDEWHQSTVPGRTGLWLDVVVPDLLGALLGFTLFTLWRRYRRE